jgi:large subunit ribosomal protein L14
MLQKETKVRTVDNTGVRWVKCIRILGKQKKYATIGDLLLVFIQSFRFKKNIEKKKMYYGLVITMKTLLARPDGIYIKADFNRIVLIAKDSLKFLGTRIYGPIYKEIRYITDKKKKKTQIFPKVVSYAKSVI